MSRRRKADPAKTREYNLRKRYGITPEYYEELFHKQNGKCAICGTSKEKLVIDHDHKTGKVRGLLCHNCNRGLGKFRDSPRTMLRVIDYLIEDEE